MENCINNNNEQTSTKETKTGRNKKLVTTVGKFSVYYNMNHKEQGLAYIFSHKNFAKQDTRNGADAEEEKLKNCFLNLGFDVHVFRDLKVAEIEYQIHEVIQMDHRKKNCIIIAVMSHGEENLQRVSAFDELYDPSEMFVEKFTADQCPSLAGKPKLFFMQCCQGEKTDPGINLYYKKGNGIETDGGKLYNKYRIPIYSDFCIMYATAKEHCAFRNEKNGSYFITALSEELTEHAYNEHFLTILTYVIRRVAIEFESNCRNPDLTKKKQIPYFESALTRLLQFVNKSDKELEMGCEEKISAIKEA